MNARDLITVLSSNATGVSANIDSATTTHEPSRLDSTTLARDSHSSRATLRSFLRETGQPTETSIRFVSIAAVR